MAIAMPTQIQMVVILSEYVWLNVSRLLSLFSMHSSSSLVFSSRPLSCQAGRMDPRLFSVPKYLLLKTLFYIYVEIVCQYCAL